jgi:hypothetical protein
MSQYIKIAKKALNNKQRHLMIIEHQRGGIYISNQVRMHACHLTSKHCTHIFDLLQKKILNKVEQEYGQRKNHWVDNKIKNHDFDLETRRRWDGPYH